MASIGTFRRGQKGLAFENDTLDSDEEPEPTEAAEASSHTPSAQQWFPTFFARAVPAVDTTTGAPVAEPISKALSSPAPPENSVLGVVRLELYGANDLPKHWNGRLKHM